MKLVIIVLFASIIFGCSTTNPFLYQPIETSEIQVRAKNISFSNKDSTISINGSSQSVRGTIDFVDVDSTHRRALIKYTPYKTSSQKHEIVLTYDISEQKILWAKATTPSNGWIENDYDVLKYKDHDKTLGVSSDSGKIIWECPFLTMVLPSQNMGVQITSGNIRVLDLITGDTLFTKMRNVRKSIYWMVHKATDLYYVADGLEYVNLNNGEGWHIKAATRDTTGEFKAAALNALSGALNILSGRPSVGSGHQPDVLYLLGSPPLLDDDKVFFAARRQIISCKRKTGEILWKTKVEIAPSRVILRNIADNLLVVYTGWRYKNNNLVSAGGAETYLLEKTTGRILANYPIDIKDPIIKILTTSNLIYLLSPQNLFIFDNKLNIKIVLSSNETYGKFFDLFISPNQQILVRTLNGILSLSDKPGEISDWINLPQIKIKAGKNPSGVIDGPRFIPTKGSWKDLVRIKFVQEHYSNQFWSGNLLWLKTGKGITCLDFESKKELITIPITYDFYNKIYINRQGWLKAYGKEQFILIPLELKY